MKIHKKSQLDKFYIIDGYVLTSKYKPLLAINLEDAAARTLNLYSQMNIPLFIQYFANTEVIFIGRKQVTTLIKLVKSNMVVKTVD